MKKNLLFFCAFLACSAAALAQPILRGTAFNAFKTKSIKLSYTSPNPANLTIPTTGGNQVYDRTSLPFGSLSERDLLPRTQAGRPTATHVDAIFGDFVGANSVITIYDQILQIDSSGVLYLGWDLPGDQYSLGPLTGNNADSIFIPSQKAWFNRPMTIQSFPMTMGKMINSGTSVLEYSGKVNVRAANLNQATFTRRYIINVRDSVVAWGALRRRNASGNVVVDSVLVALRTFSSTDSFFLSGVPAPSNLLALFGATQGQTTNGARYGFYKQGRPFAIHTVTFNPNAPTVATGGVFEWGDALTTNTRELLPEADWSFSPNPVQQGTLFIDYASSTPLSMSVFDATGRAVDVRTLPANAVQSPVQVNLNPALPAGLYLIHLANDAFQKTLKVMIGN